MRLDKSTELAVVDRYPGPAILAVWTDIVADQRDAFNAWYVREHIPERLAVPGFWRGRRFAAVSGSPEYFACYDIASLGVPVSAAYLERLNNPTESTCRVMPGFRNMTRAICKVASRCGRGTGAAMLTMQFESKPSNRNVIHKHIVETVLPRACERDGIVSAQLWLADNTPTPMTRERELRANDDGSITSALVLEAVEPSALIEPRDSLMDPTSVFCRMTARALQTAIYRLLYSLDSRE